MGFNVPMRMISMLRNGSSPPTATTRKPPMGITAIVRTIMVVSATGVEGIGNKIPALLQRKLTMDKPNKKWIRMETLINA